jgi:hypothetical protein
MHKHYAMKEALNEDLKQKFEGAAHWIAPIRAGSLIIKQRLRCLKDVSS